MPGKIKVKVLAGRNLPVMDRAGDTTDAFVEIKFGGITHKTDVCRKSLNPHWNSTEWYRFEVDEAELQDEPLQLRLMDHDTYSANDAIGKVVISLAPLLAREAGSASTGATGGAVLSGWLPVFDTLHGIRGELHVVVKLELFSDFNKYKTSSVGVQFFHCPMIPPGYQASAIHGFVEELVVNDDPEYQWIDKIRTPRASNEARQVAFIKLSNQVQRLVGLKASELGANAVVGYQQDFDLEGEAGVVARAIGTAVSIKPLPTPQPNNLPPCTQQQLKKYLDILAIDEESVTDLNQYYQTHQEELLKMVGILNPKDPSLLDEPDCGDDDEKSFESLMQPTGFSECPKPYTGGRSIYQDEYISQKSLKHLSEDQVDLDRLLKRTASTNSGGPLTRLKKLKGSMFRRKGRRDSQKSEKQDDEISLRSTSSDTSRISLNDIKKEMRRFKRMKVPKLAKIEGEEEEGIGMASILARSVIHAHTSLACISEAQDSEASPDSTLRKTSESEPTVNFTNEQNKINIDEDSKISEGSAKRSPEGHCSSLDNIKSDKMPFEPQRKKSESCPTSPIVERSDNLLKPGEIGYFGSISSALSAESSEIYTSSDEDEDDSSDMKSNGESMETTSSLVNSVLRHHGDQNFIAQMEQKLADLELASHVHSENNVKTTKDVLNVKDTKDETAAKMGDVNVQTNEKSNLKLDIETDSHKKRDTLSPISKDVEKFVPAKHNFNFPSIFVHKNLQTTLSAPSSPVERKSFVYRSSKRIKKQLSKISKSRMVKSLSHYSLLPKKKHEDPKTAMSQPGSSSDVTSKAPSDSVLGYPFLSYTDLLSLDKEQPPERLHRSDELVTSKVSMYIGSQPESRTSFSGPSDREHIHLQKPKPLPHHQKPEVKPSSLTHTAMEVILFDTVHSLLIPTSPEVNTHDKKFFDKVNIELEKIENVNSDKNKTVDSHRDTINENSTEKKGSIKSKKGSKKEKKLTRQDSVRSTEESKMSKDLKTNIVIPCKLTNRPMLQHFHPILSGVHLETIPSLSCSLDMSDSLDVSCDTNSASVCGNSHAVCDVDRSERERDKCDKDKGSPRHARHESFGGREAASANVQNVSLNSSSTPLGIHRRSSDSDLSVTPKGGSQNASVGNIGGGAILRPSMNSNNLDMLEYPFLTMTEFPPGFIVHIGGTVCSRSVKLVDGGGESAARAAWWAELRTEIRAHARALRCTAVLGYSERASVREDVCVLSASGTAAVINLDCDLGADDSVTASVGDGADDEEACGAAHVPYSTGAPPYRAELAGCGGCRRARVPTVLLATCGKPNRLASYGKAVVVTAVAARGRRAPPAAEPGARDLSDQLPFLEYELHKLLLAKLRMQGANALFSLQTQVAIGERCVMALASGAAVRLAALPPPAPPRIKASENDKNAMEIQKALWDTFNANKAANGYDVAPEHISNGVLPECEGEEPPAIDLCADKDACVLELDEAEDVETARALAERRLASVLMTPTLRPARSAPHAFTQVWRARIGSGGQAERMVASALAAARYKLRRLQPAALAAPTYHLDLPDDEIQLVVSGTAIPLQDPKSEPVAERNGNHDDDDIFALDEEQLVKSLPDQVEEKNNGPGAGRVALSTGAAAGAGGAGRRVCALRLLFVRETTAVRELGGLSGFLHTFTCEVMAIVRAYTAALGGNALTSFYMTQLMLQDNAHKNQGQCLLSVGGDVVHVT